MGRGNEYNSAVNSPLIDIRSGAPRKEASVPHSPGGQPPVPEILYRSLALALTRAILYAEANSNTFLGTVHIGRKLWQENFHVHRIY